MGFRKFPDTTYFVLEATYARPVGPHGPEDTWMFALTARKGSTTPPPDAAPPEQRIAATLQSSFRDPSGDPPVGPVARLNTPAPAVLLPLLPDPGFLPQNSFNALCSIRRRKALKCTYSYGSPSIA